MERKFSHLGFFSGAEFGKQLPSETPPLTALIGFESFLRGEKLGLRRVCGREMKKLCGGDGGGGKVKGLSRKESDIVVDRCSAENRCFKIFFFFF